MDFAITIKGDVNIKIGKKVCNGAFITWFKLSMKKLRVTFTLQVFTLNNNMDTTTITVNNPIPLKPPGSKLMT